MSLVYKHGPKIRSNSAKPGVEPHALCPLHDNQRIRSDDSPPRTGVCNRAYTPRAGTHADAFGRRHRSPYIGMLGLAMAGHQFRGRNDPRASYLDVWPSRFAEEQSVEGPGATPSVARRIHTPLETEDNVFPARGL